MHCKRAAGSGRAALGRILLLCPAAACKACASGAAPAAAAATNPPLFLPPTDPTADYEGPLTGSRRELLQGGWRRAACPPDAAFNALMCAAPPAPSSPLAPRAPRPLPCLQPGHSPPRLRRAAPQVSVVGELRAILKPAAVALQRAWPAGRRVAAVPPPSLSSPPDRLPAILSTLPPP